MRTKLFHQHKRTTVSSSIHRFMSTTTSTSPLIIPERIPQTTSVHGYERVDNYFWLREKQNQKVVQYLESENQYQEQQLEHTKQLQQELYDEIVGRMNETDISAPYKYGPYMYYYRTEKGKQYRIYCRKRAESLELLDQSQEEVLLDLNQVYEEEKTEFLSLGIYRVSPDHNILAYSLDLTGEEIYMCYFKDLTTGVVLKDRISLSETMGHSFQWANDASTCFYTTQDAALRPYKVWRKVVNRSDPDSVSEPKCIYTDEDERFWIGVSRSMSGQYLFISSESKITSEYWFLNADHPNDELKVIKKRQQDLEYNVAHQGDYFYIWENGNGCRNFRFIRVPVGTTNIESFGDAEEVFPYDDNRMIDYMTSFKNHIALFVREEGLPKIMIVDPSNTTNYYYVHFPDAAYDVGVAENKEYDSDLLRIGYSSFITPETTYDYDMVEKKLILRKQKEVFGYDQTLYTTERITVTARDGIKVPVSMVYRKREKQTDGTFLKKDGKNPLYLYGYGSYGYPIDVSFMESAISLLDRNIVFAIAHIRGGGENGRFWRDSGRMMTKLNTFNDFIDSAKYLIDNGYTSPEYLCVSGGSAGGLLIGACVNMAPELFKAAVLRVPFVDVVNTLSDTSIPLTVTEFEEFGNPVEFKDVYDYMMKYSPYDNIEREENRDKKYPAILIAHSFNDKRVQYWEGAKYCSAMRHWYTQKPANTTNKILMKTVMSAGHAGKSGRYERIKETAHVYAFVLDEICPKE
jgi:oligopeptidase B